MRSAQTLDALLVDLDAGLAHELVGEQAAAHADLAVNAPDGEFDSFAVERFLPRQHVLVHAVDQRAVEIEQENSLDAHRRLPLARDRRSRRRTIVDRTRTAPQSAVASSFGPTIQGSGEAKNRKIRPLTIGVVTRPRIPC